MENVSRDLVDYLAIFAPFVLSIVAVCISIAGSRKQNTVSMKQEEITQQQNRIALFEKRYEIYAQLIKISVFSKTIDNDFDRRKLYMYFATVFGDGIVPDIKIEIEHIHPLYQRTLNILNQAVFLFDTDIKEAIDNLSSSLVLLMSSVEDPTTNEDEFYDKKQAFIECVNRIKKSYQKAIESELKI